MTFYQWLEKNGLNIQEANDVDIMRIMSRNDQKRKELEEISARTNDENKKREAANKRKGKVKQ